MHIHTRHRRALSAAAVVAGIIALSACSSDAAAGGSGPSASNEIVQGYNSFSDVTVDQTAADLLPADTRKAGVLNVVMNVSSPPTKFYADDNKTIIGINPDVARLIGRVLGLDVTISDVQFDGIIPALQNGRYDLAVASMGANPDRLKVLDMIPYARWGSAIAVPSGNPKNISSPDNLCGLTVAVQKGSYQEGVEIPRIAKEFCAGAAKIQTVVLPSQDDAMLQLAAGRVDAVVADAPVLGYQAKRGNARFEVAGQIPPPAESPTSVALGKSSALSPAVEAALQRVVALPQYRDSFSVWGVGPAAIDQTGLLR